ncbi:conserved hypothetical protein, secreted, partial [Candidatus Magnetomorum sp. HK-1]
TPVILLLLSFFSLSLLSFPSSSSLSFSLPSLLFSSPSSLPLPLPPPSFLPSFPSLLSSPFLSPPPPPPFSFPSPFSSPLSFLPPFSSPSPSPLFSLFSFHSVQDDNQDNNTKLCYTYQAYPGVTNKALAERVKTGATHIDFTLRTQCTLSGTVLDLYGSAIPGAEINARSDISGQIVPAVTDQNGQY